MEAKAIAVWTDPDTHQTCYVVPHARGAELELRHRGACIITCQFASIADAVSWARLSRPLGAERSA